MIDCKQKTFDLPFQIKFPWFKVPIITTVQVDITEKQKDFFHVLILHINVTFYLPIWIQMLVHVLLWGEIYCITRIQ